jgi:hypothetical protein
LSALFPAKCWTYVPCDFWTSVGWAVIHAVTPKTTTPSDQGLDFKPRTAKFTLNPPPAVPSLSAFASVLAKLKPPSRDAITDIQTIFRQSCFILDVEKFRARAELSGR